MKTDEPGYTKDMKIRKNYLLSGILIFLVGIVVIFPIESRDSIVVEGLGFTYSTTTVGVLIVLYGLLTSDFLRGLLLILLCIVMSVLFTALVEDDGWGREIVIFWLGVPSGAISGALFLITNRLFIRNKPNRIMLYVIRGCVLIAIYAIVVSIMRWGGDVLFHLEQYYNR